MSALAHAVASAPILRSAAGEPPLGADGESFRAEQGEILQPDNPSHRSLATRVGVIELNNGKWLSFPFGIDRPQYDSRELALRAGIAALVRKARRYMRSKEGEGTHWTEGYAGRVIEWALSVKPEKDLVHRTSANASAVISHPGDVPTSPPEAKPDPYLITGPALISFSGGRTSGYMLRQIIEAHGGTLPDDVKVVFANTGKEREETLEFVKRCSFHWKVKIHWVEWTSDKPGFREVNFDTASREGEPFAALIAKKKMPPNWQARFCTQFLKVKAMTAFALSLGWTECSYKEVIGLRDDEGHRILKMLARNEKDGRQCIIPLAKAKIVKADVMAFWNARSFDLDLKDGEGNCDLCFLKPKRLRVQLAADRPKSVDWWNEQEISTNGFFDRRTRYSELLGTTLAATGDVQQPEEFDAECGLSCPADGEVETDTDAGVTDDGRGGHGDAVNQSSITDPIVAALVAAHRVRKVYPAGHTFAMTNPIQNGRMVTLGTCACGDTFSYAWGSYERMDAAIEAHWQKFDHLPEKADGRGQPIGEAAPVEAKKPRRKKNKESDAGGPPASFTSAPEIAPVAGADVVIDEAAPIGAGSTEVSEPPGKQALSNAEADPVREAGLHGGSLTLSMAAEPSDDWSPMLIDALALAWRDELPDPDPVKEFEATLPLLMGPEEKRRKVTEFKLALKQKPVNLGPLFGNVPPPLVDDSELMEASES